MKFCVLMGSPRREGNTAALLGPFLEECQALRVETETIWLYDKTVTPCLGCMVCQSCLDGPGCVQKDDFQGIFQAMVNCDGIILATPIYAFFCTPPMKALLDRAIYAGKKNYGTQKGPALLGCQRLATIATCGYPPEYGADLWEEGLKRLCRYGSLEYLGILCRQDRGRGEPFMNEDRAQAARDFARAIWMTIRLEDT